MEPLGTGDSGHLSGQAEQAGPSRSVIASAFTLLTLLHRLGPARVSELQRLSGLPRTTVHRLLGQLEEAGVVERTAGRWRVGPTLVELGTGVPAEPRLRSVARRPLMDLATATGGLVSLSVEIAGQGLVVEVIPGVHRMPFEPEPGIQPDEATLAAAGLAAGRLASIRAHEQAHHGDLRPVIDAGGVDPRVSCVAAPLLLSPHDAGAVSLMMPGAHGVTDLGVRATRRTAGRIATELSKQGRAEW